MDCIVARIPGDGTIPASFEGLKSQIDIEWTDCVGRARWRLFGNANWRRTGVWLIVGWPCIGNRPIPRLCGAGLGAAWPDATPGVAKGAITPPETGWDWSTAGAVPDDGTPVAMTSAERLRWRGLMVLGVDGTSSGTGRPENRESFGLPPSKRRTSGYPQVEVVA